MDKQDYVRAHILSKKIAPKAFVERKGEVKGEIGIEGTAIEAPPEVGCESMRWKCDLLYISGLGCVTVWQIKFPSSSL